MRSIAHAAFRVRSAGLWTLLLLVLMAGPPAANAATVTAKRLAGVQSWGYQLQKPDPAEIAASPFDVVVVDYSRNGTEAGRFSSDEIKQMQRKPDGSRRYVLAYLSIGEAESYRYYWNRKWVTRAPLVRDRLAPKTTVRPPAGATPKTVLIPRLVAPSWLGHENPDWPGNYQVRFWYDNWQELIMHDDDSYLRRIQAAGFDGVYLDRVDAYYDTKLDRKFAIEKMTEFVIELAQIARKRKPGFIVVPQNGEELLDNPAYVAAIDGIGKEDLLYGLQADGQPNTLAQISSKSARLQAARNAGLAVLVVEYLKDMEARRTVGGMLRSLGFTPYFGPRSLDRLVVPAPNR